MIFFVQQLNSIVGWKSECSLGKKLREVQSQSPAMKQEYQGSWMRMLSSSPPILVGISKKYTVHLIRLIFFESIPMFWQSGTVSLRISSLDEPAPCYFQWCWLIWAVHREARAILISGGWDFKNNWWFSGDLPENLHRFYSICFANSEEAVLIVWLQSSPAYWEDYAHLRDSERVVQSFSGTQRYLLSLLKLPRIPLRSVSFRPRRYSFW